MSVAYAMIPEGWGVPRETVERLDRYARMVEQWGKTINLVARPSYDEIWSRHIIDSLQLAPLLRNEQWQTLVDLGSGGGFPVVPLALCYPEKQLIAIDADQRKSAFLKAVCAQLGIANLTVLAKRIETITDVQADIITARACASLEKLIESSLHLRHNTTRCFFLKGKHAFDELQHAQQSYRFSHSHVPSATEEGAVILAIHAISPNQR